MSYETKLEQARAKIEEHNARVTNKVDATKFIECLQNKGATSDETLGFTRYEDLVGCGLPEILARTIVESIFRKNVGLLLETKPDSKVFVSEKKALAMTIKDLVERYDPVEFDNPVGKRLATLSKGHPCIAFNTDGSVNVEASAKEVKSLRDGFEAREHTKVNGTPTRLYKVGDRPGNFLDENPLYPGRPLRDGECDQTGRGWDGVSQVVKTVLHLAVTRTGELSISQLKDAHDTLDLVVGKDAAAAEAIVRQRFQKASIMYGDLEQEGKLPTLKLARGSASKKQDPFFHKTY